LLLFFFSLAGSLSSLFGKREDGLPFLRPDQGRSCLPADSFFSDAGDYGRRRGILPSFPAGIRERDCSFISFFFFFYYRLFLSFPWITHGLANRLPPASSPLFSSFFGGGLPHPLFFRKPAVDIRASSFFPSPENNPNIPFPPFEFPSFPDLRPGGGASPFLVRSSFVALWSPSFTFPLSRSRFPFPPTQEDLILPLCAPYWVYILRPFPPARIAPFSYGKTSERHRSAGLHSPFILVTCMTPSGVNLAFSLFFSEDLFFLYEGSH